MRCRTCMVKITLSKFLQPDTTTIDNATLRQVESALQEAQIQPKSVVIDGEQVLIRVVSDSDQLQARDVLMAALGNQYIVALNLAAATPDWLESIGAAPLKLGLDLRGGVHFLMEVDMAEAVRKIQDQLRDSIRTELRDERIRYTSVNRDGNDVVVVLRSAEDFAAADSYLNNRYAGYNEVTDSNTNTIRLRMTDTKIRETQDYAISQNVTILRNRVNELGVAEPIVQRQGAERIVVQLPGVQDTARAKEILGATATLEFRMLDSDNSVSEAERGRVPFGSELFPNRNGGNALLRDDVILTGDHIVNASAGFDEYQRPQVSISLDGAGGDKMSLATRDNVGKPMATLFIEYKATGDRDADGKLIFEPLAEVINIATINSRLGSSFRITGISSQQEAQNLALLLRAGALIAPIQIVEERTIGPSLGQENINMGMQAIIWGFVMVLVFMMIYYRKFGLVANAALAANLVLIVGVMSMIPGATLTLPGHGWYRLDRWYGGGCVTYLFLSEVREEIKRQAQSTTGHYIMVMTVSLSTIADANITTLIAAIILFAVGTGPIKGFAVTLAIGIITSMFTAIVGTRAVVNAVWGGKRIDKLSV